MKIDLNGAYRAYTKSSATLPQQSEKSAGKSSRTSVGQMDSISISSEAAQKSEFDKLLHNTATEADAAVSPERLSSLRQAVQSGDYRIPTEKLAEAVLNAYV